MTKITTNIFIQFGERSMRSCFRNFKCDKPPMCGDIMSHYLAVRVRNAFKSPKILQMIYAV